jgi:hypothetical protein
LLLVVFLMVAILTGVRWNLHVILICISFIARDSEHFCMCFLIICSSAFEKVLFSSVAHFFIDSLIWGEFSFLSSLYILIISFLSDVYLAKIFFHYVAGLFNLGTISFIVQKIFIFMFSHLSILSLSCWVTWVILRKFVPMPVASEYSLLFSVLASRLQVWYQGL